MVNMQQSAEFPGGLGAGPSEQVAAVVASFVTASLYGGGSSWSGSLPHQMQVISEREAPIPNNWADDVQID